MTWLIKGKQWQFETLAILFYDAWKIWSNADQDFRCSASLDFNNGKQIMEAGKGENERKDLM